MANKLAVLLSREDFRRNPAMALCRRLTWRCRWTLMSEPWQLGIGGDMKIRVPRCGAGAMIFYQGSSEPETARFVLRLLRPGMVFFDVGAHIGEYTLLAAQQVGPSGQVHAFEPQPDTFGILRDNVELNALHNVRLNQMAVSRGAGEVDFTVRTEPSLSSMAGVGDIERHGVVSQLRVPATTLDRYCRESRAWPDLVKIDVEGAEFLVLQGADWMLDAAAEHAPALVFEYGPENYPRFAYTFSEMEKRLIAKGYKLFHLDERGTPQFVPEGTSPLDGTRNVVASKVDLQSRLTCAHDGWNGRG